MLLLAQPKRSATFTAATYGPTKGPPLPTGAVPAGSIAVVAVSPAARARFRRPLPVPDDIVGSALRARRPTIAPLLAAGSRARSNAAAPATSAAAADVPETV